MTDLDPGSRPRRGVLAVGAAAVAAALVGGLVVALPSGTAAAAELTTFASCDEVAAWGRTSADRFQVTLDGDQVPVAADGAETSGAPSSQEGGDAGAGSAGRTVGRDGGTNVVVEGVDELDVIDRLDDDRALVTAGTTLAIADLSAARLVAEVPVPAGAQVTYDPDASVAWVVGTGAEGTGVSVRRVAVGDASLDPGDEWTTSGWLVDARRVGDRLHLVAADGFTDADGEVLPFADGPVPCDEVLHPVGPSDPTATLLVTLPVDGDLVPEHAAEVVGAGQLVHVTTDAAYLATPLWEGEAVTAIHRFDLDDLTPTGSGRVAGSLLDEFSMSEHDGHLRVAVTEGGGVGVGRPIPIEDGPGGDVIIDQEPIDVPADGVAGPAADVAPIPPTGLGGEALNEVVVLDTDGDLDVVGRTARFGHPGETLHGIRFVGEVAYAVTFLRTDPFYVVDLADPAAPRVAGEVELPGFSAYLHPISDTLVAGFGPDEDGQASVKLFDVSDPASPQVVDDLELGDESAVVGDHHAFVDLGDGRFAVPASRWRDEFPPECSPEDQAEARDRERELSGQIEAAEAADPEGDGAEVLWEQLDELNAEGCLYPGNVAESAVVVIDAAGGSLVEVDRLEVRADEPATRVLPAEDGWSLLAGEELVVLDADGAERARLPLG